MGQYHLVVNLTKREFIDPHQLGAGLKLMEQFWTSPGTGGPLLLLLAVSNGRGGGDANVKEGDRTIVGRWGGDRIAMVGDYAEDRDLTPEDKASQIYSLCRGDDDEPLPEGVTGYTDITPLVVAFIERTENCLYVGKGWRRIVHPGDRVWQWGVNQTKQVGVVDKVTPKTCTIKWESGARQTFNAKDDNIAWFVDNSLPEMRPDLVLVSRNQS